LATKRRAKNLAMESQQIAKMIASAAYDKKAIDIEALDVRKTVSYADFFVICSARTPTQVKAIYNRIRQVLEEAGIPLVALEGEDHNRWVLMDYVDVVVHVMVDSLRGLYELERLWADAGRLELGLPNQLYYPGQDDPFLDDDE